MKEVTKDEFYNAVGPLDVTLSVIGNFPYTTIFKLRNGTEKGKVVQGFSEGNKYPVLTKYYKS